MSWANALSGLLGGVSSYARDPGAWLGALGTGLGVYDMYRTRKAEADYLKKQAQWQKQVQALANQPLNINPDVANRVAELSGAPLDVDSFYNPGKNTIQSQIEAGLAARGIQPGGNYFGAVGEGLSKHWLSAADRAQALRNSQIQAAMGRYQGEIDSQLGTRSSALQGMLGATHARPNMEMAGDLGALGKYLAARNTQNAMDTANTNQKSYQDQVLEMLKRNTGGSGYMAPPPSGAFYPDEMTGDPRGAY